MNLPDLPHLAAAFAAAFLAGSINSVAGGGTLISFPTLIWLGMPSVIANATSTVAIWPGSLGSIWGFRRELGHTDKQMRKLLLPGMVGAAGGAWLLRVTSSKTFDHIVPFLILFAVLLFMVQAPIQERLKTAEPENRRTGKWMAFATFALLLVGLYGGYFGAGISIMNLSILGILGMTDILEMNALTSLFSLCINAIAIVFFVFAGLIDWPYVPVMAVGAIIGGYGAAGVARRIGRVMVRRFVVAVGLTIAITMFVQMAHR